MEKRKYSLYKLQVWETFQASQQNTKKLKNFELAANYWHYFDFKNHITQNISNLRYLNVVTLV